MHNQYLAIAAAVAGTKPINSGKIRNRGIEFTTNYHWLINRNWSWKTGFNISYNDNKILETYNNGKTHIVDLGQDSGLKLLYKVGESYGDLYANSIQTREDGSYILDRNGVPRITNDCNTLITYS